MSQGFTDCCLRDRGPQVWALGLHLDCQFSVLAARWNHPGRFKNYRFLGHLGGAVVEASDS